MLDFCSGLPLLDIRPNVKLIGEARPWLAVEVPVRVRNLENGRLDVCSQRSEGRWLRQYRGGALTASGLIFASGASNFQSLVLSMSIIPSIMAWATCTPFGPNSRANDWAKALMANLPVAKEEHSAEPLIAAVAEVKMRVGGYSAEVALSSSGRQACAK